MVRNSTLLLVLVLASCSGSGRSPVGEDDASDVRQRETRGCRLGPCDMFDDDTQVAIDVGTDAGDAWETPDALELPHVDELDDVSPDLADSDDQADLTTDVFPDIEPDLPPVESAAFRVDWLSLAQPQLCYPMGDACMPLQDEIDQQLASSIGYGELNLIGSFAPLLVDEPVILKLAQGNCNLGGNGSDDSLPYGSCAYDPAIVPATFEQVVIQSSGECSPGVPAPCFLTGESDFALQLSGVVLGLSNATVEARITDWPPSGALSDGIIQGWLPEEIAKSVAVNIGGLLPQPTLYDLLKECPTQPEVVDGHLAWPVMLPFTAIQVEFVD